MERRDYLIKQFEALGEALRKLLSKVSLLKDIDPSDIEVSEIDDLMKAEIGLNLQDISGLNDEGFLSYLLEKHLQSADLSKVINLLVDLATIKNKMVDEYNSNQLLTKALFLGNHLTLREKMVYFDNIVALDVAAKMLK
ncbi:MAG: hypothetical protein EOO85_05255 [Pedobacter sp.]|nr:MAG: hypothetical protein EOO85_05255 [Pedobacter sp.]